MGISEITMSRRSVTINDLVSIASTTTPFVNIPKEDATILSCPFSQLHRDIFDMISIKIYAVIDDSHHLHRLSNEQV